MESNGGRTFCLSEMLGYELRIPKEEPNSNQGKDDVDEPSPPGVLFNASN
jgi:hypothetical protein